MAVQLNMLDLFMEDMILGNVNANKRTREERKMPNSKKKSLQIQAISAVALLMDLYSASVEDNDTTDCFLDFQPIRLPPINMQNPPTDFLLVKQAPKSLSQKKLREIRAVIEDTQIRSTLKVQE